MWTRATPLALSVSRPTSASSTTRRLCTGDLAGGGPMSQLCSSGALIYSAWTKSYPALDHTGEADIYFPLPVPGSRSRISSLM